MIPTHKNNTLAAQEVLEQVNSWLLEGAFSDKVYTQKIIPYIRQLSGNQNLQLIAIEQLNLYVHNRGIKRLYDDIFELKACIYTNMDDYKQALHYFNQAIEIRKANKNYQQLARSCVNVGNIYTVIGEHESAVRYLIEAIKAIEQTENKNLASYCYNKLSEAYTQIRFYEKALVYSDKAVGLVLKGHDRFVPQIYAQKAYLHFHLKQYDEAIKWYQECLANSKNVKANLIPVIRSYAYLAESCYKIGDFENALAHADKSVYYLKQAPSNQTNLAIIIHQKRGKLLFNLKKYKKAIKALNQSIVLMQRIEYGADIDEMYKLMAKCHKNVGDFENACHYYELFAEAREALYSASTTNNIIEAEARFMVAQKESVIDKLNRQQKQLENINAELDAFVGKAAHDLKEPIRMISSFTNIIDRKFNKTKDKNDQVYFDYVQDGAKRMTKLINDLLEFARSGNRKTPETAVDLNEVFEVIDRNLLLKIQETNTEIILPNNLPFIKGHFTEILLIFQNLITNSIKFTDKEVIPKIKVNYSSTPLEHLITLQDNGIGIPLEKQKAVFEAFNRLHTRTEYEGTGLGLATCKKIIERNGGKIWLDSIVGKGSTFYIAFPITKTKMSKEQN